MKKLFLSLFVMAAGACSALAQSQEQGAAMRARQSYVTPGYPHKLMAEAEGNWTTQNTMWMAPGTAPQQSAGSVTNKMMLGGRYQQSFFKATVMGRPMEGYSILGYDNKTDRYTFTWMDNMGTGTLTLTGTWEEATKTIHLSGKAVDPVSGAEVSVRQEFMIKDKDHQVMELYRTTDGQEMKVMEVKYTRAKK